MLYPRWDGFKRRCGKHTDHFLTCWLGHLHGVGKCRLCLKGRELNLSSPTLDEAGIDPEERYVFCTCWEVGNKKAVRAPNKWSRLKDLKKGTSIFLDYFHILLVLAGKILNRAIN